MVVLVDVSGMDPITRMVLASQQQMFANTVQTTVARKTLDAERAQGQAVMQLLEGAKDTQAQANQLRPGDQGSGPDGFGRGGGLDVYA